MKYQKGYSQINNPEATRSEKVMMIVAGLVVLLQPFLN